MCVIYLRVQAQIPVVIMGETGCGKTSLLEYFCKTVRNERLEIFNIHAGRTYEEIVKQMEYYIE
jgi:ABC-type lipoprotein export system ATPase subunit